MTFIDNLNRNQKTTGTNANKKAVHLMDTLIKKDEVDLTDLTNGLNTAYVTLSYFRKKGMSLTHSLTEKAMISLTSLRKIKVEPKFELDSITNKSIYKKGIYIDWLEDKEGVGDLKHLQSKAKITLRNGANYENKKVWTKKCFLAIFVGVLGIWGRGPFNILKIRDFFSPHF